MRFASVLFPRSSSTPLSLIRALARTLALVGPLALLSAGGCEGCDNTDPTPPPSTAAAGKNVFVSGKAVRSCQAVFRASGEEIPQVVFSDAVVGEFIPRAPRFALAFTADGDTSLDQIEVARFQFTKNGAPSPTLQSARCTDGAGAVVDDALRVSN